MNLAMQTNLSLHCLHQRPLAPRLAPQTHRRRQHGHCCRAAAAAGCASPEAKAHLLQLVEGTQRGASASRAQRGAIEEAQVAVESGCASSELDYSLLGGHWLLRYTTASDVKPILAADSGHNPLALPLRVGNIYQRFTSPDNGSGKVDNIIQIGVPNLLQGTDGATLTVQASYEVQTGHTISLMFDAANVGGLKIDGPLEAVIAPALLPRGTLQLMILQAIKQFHFKVPFRSAAQVAAGVASGSSRSNAGGSYYLSYLDEDMLIGRAIALGGTFVFTRAPPPEH